MIYFLLPVTFLILIIYLYFRVRKIVSSKVNINHILLSNKIHSRKNNIQNPPELISSSDSIIQFNTASKSPGISYNKIYGKDWWDDERIPKIPPKSEWSLSDKLRSPNWTNEVIHFLDNFDNSFLDRAVSATDDPAIKVFLNWMKMYMPAPIPINIISELVNRDEDCLEAALVRMLLHIPSIKTCGTEPATSNCKRLAELCHKWELYEIEARLHSKIGVESAIRRDWQIATHHFNSCINLLRLLVEQNPNKFRFRLADELYNFGRMLSELNMLTASQDLLQESLSIFRNLLASGNDFKLYFLSDVLAELASVKRRMGDLELAIELQEEGQLLDELGAKMDKENYLERYMMCLHNRSNLHRSKRDFPNSIDDCKLALKMANSLKPTPANLMHLAGLHSNVGSILREIRDYPQARAHLTNAILILKPLSNQYPSKLADTLNKLGSLEADLGQHEDAFNYYTEAIETWKVSNSLLKDAHRMELADTLINHAIEAIKLTKLVIARKSLNTAIALLEELSKEQPKIILKSLAAAYHQYSKVSILLKENDEVFTNLQKSLNIRRHLFADSHSLHIRDFSASLCDTGLAYWLLDNDFAKAIPYWDEAISTIESFKTSSETLHLLKGRISPAYNGILRFHIGNGDIEKGFEYICALRSAQRNSSPQNSLSATISSLHSVELKLLIKMELLVIQSLDDGSDLFILLNGTTGAQYEINSKFHVIAKAIRERISNLFANVGNFESITNLAKQAWEALPLFVANSLRPHRDHDTIISGDGYWTTFPWEILKFDDGDDDYLGLHRTLARRTSVTGDSLGDLRYWKFENEHRTAVVICPWNVPGAIPLDGAKLEGKYVGNVLKNYGYRLLPNGQPLIGEDANFDTFIDAIGAGPSIIHYTGHGNIIDNNEQLILWNMKSKAGFEGNQTSFGKSDFVNAKHSGELVFNQGAVVILNSCFTGTTHFFGGQREDLVSHFLEQGAVTIIASSYPIFDEVGFKLGSLLYDPDVNFLCKNIGNTIVLIRAALEKYLRGSKLWPAWALFSLHGNPFVDISYPLTNTEGRASRNVTDRFCDLKIFDNVDQVEKFIRKFQSF